MFSLLVNLSFIAILGYCAYKLFDFIHAPVPALIGSICVFGTVNALGYLPTFPAFEIGFFGQSVLGIAIAARFDRDSLAIVKKLLGPILISLIGVFFFSALSALVLCAFFNIDLGTSLIASAPGGIPEMLALGFSLGMDTTAIAFIQVFRVTLVMLIVPVLIKKSKINSQALAKPEEFLQNGTKKPSYLDLAFLALCAAVCGGLFYVLHIPAPFILGSITGSLSFLLARNLSLKVPKSLLCFAHTAIGLITAQHITKATLGQFPSLWIPLLVSTVFLLLGGAILGLIIQKITKWDFITCQLACAPGGLIQMVATAKEIEANVIVVTVLHSVRLIFIVVFWSLFVRFVV